MKKLRFIALYLAFVLILFLIVFTMVANPDLLANLIR
jgi:hypothetical protein